MNNSPKSKFSTNPALYIENIFRSTFKDEMGNAMTSTQRKSSTSLKAIFFLLFIIFKSNKKNLFEMIIFELSINRYISF